MDEEIGPDAGTVFWDLVEGRARLAALEEIEGAFSTAGHSSEIMDRVKKRKAKVIHTLKKLEAEGLKHHHKQQSKLTTDGGR